MEIIMNYLDNMFMNFPQTPDVLRAKSNLAEMMEDKYNELIHEGKAENEAIGIVISEFGNIRELADELGIGSPFPDIKKEKGSEKSEKRHQDANGYDKTEEDMRYLSDVEAEEYLFVVKQSASKIAVGVLLCICSPITLLLLGGIQEYIINISDGIVSSVGISVLLLFLACAVGLFISAGMKLDNYEYLKKECFRIDPAYGQALYDTRESRKSMFTIKIMAGVILCLISVIPVIITGVLSSDMISGFFSTVAVGMLLVTIGIAVSLFITAGMEMESYQVILQEKEYSLERKEKGKLLEILSSIFWPVVAVIYLGWSFITGGWLYTWIIWPLAGIIFEIISEIFRIKEKRQ